jgi:FAD/FMN-containing dehydrogenase
MSLAELPNLSAIPGTILPFGYGRSYGDSCLNEGGVLVDSSGLNRLIEFDEELGLMRCEAGVMLADILSITVPRGWFLPTTPGTKYVSVGGAIANDVHGKNHHRAGTFGSHVTRFEILRSDGTRMLCSPMENPDMFRATIGGLGLTGLILWAEFRLRATDGPYIQMEQIPFGNVDEFFEISADSDEHYEYTMSFVDCLAVGRHLGRGLFMRGNHAWQRSIPGKAWRPKQRFTVPITLPSVLLNRFSVRAFNAVHYRSQYVMTKRQVIPYDPFFYPLDSVGHWNRAYGSQGFLQYQCVVPYAGDREPIKEILRTIATSGQGSFLAVFKTFGSKASPGLLSFPRPGVTLALDFPYRGSPTLTLLDHLDAIVLAARGAVYPAKDARMSPACFRESFPRWSEFAQYKDSKFSSSFWRRVMEDCA